MADFSFFYGDYPEVYEEEVEYNDDDNAEEGEDGGSAGPPDAEGGAGGGGDGGSSVRLPGVGLRCFRLLLQVEKINANK